MSKNRMVFPSNTNNIEQLYERARYIFDEFGTEPFTSNELMERFSQNGTFVIEPKTMETTFNCLYHFKLFSKTDNKKYKITKFGRDFARGVFEEEKDFYNNFLVKVNENYTCQVRNAEIKPYIYLMQTFCDLNGIVYKYELCPLFFVNSQNEYESYINTVKKSRNTNNPELMVDFVREYLNTNKITLDDIRVVVSRDSSQPIHLLETLNLIVSNVSRNKEKITFPGEYRINADTYYKMTEDALEMYFSEKELIRYYSKELENIPADIDERKLNFNSTEPHQKKTTKRMEMTRNRKVVAFTLKRDNHEDFFKDIESSYGHPTPKTLDGSVKVHVHHVVPLKYQKLFTVNLDISPLCICSCLICHEILHDDKNGELKLKQHLVKYMYEQKKEILKEYLNISTYAEFAKLYNL